jgi:hypothetical protein
VLKVIDQGSDDTTNAISIRKFFAKTAGVATTTATADATVIQTRHRIPEAALHGGQPLFRGLVDSGRKVLAGLLFIMPGIVSDALALALLLLPINTNGRFARSRVGDAIEGDFRRIDR